MKILDVLKTANSNLARNKLRSILTIIAIFIGSFTIISNTAIQAGVNSFIDNQVDSYGGDGFISIASADTVEALAGMMGTSSDEPKEYDPNKNQTSATAITEDQIDQLKNLPAILPDSLQTLNAISVTYVTSDQTDKKYILEASVLPPGNIHIDTISGHQIDNSVDNSQIILPSGYAKALGFDSDEALVNQTITLAVLDPYTQTVKNFEATVVDVQAPGIVTQGAAIANNHLGTLIHEENTKYYPAEQKSQVYTLTAEFDYNNYSEQEVRDQISDIGLVGITVSDIVGSIKTFFDIIITVFNIFGIIALLAAAIGIINTLFMSVQERTREIGLDKALGMSSGKVFLSFSLEAIALGFWGSLCGIAVSMIVGNLANHAFHQPGGFLAEFPTFHLVEYTPLNCILIVLLIMFIAFLAGTLPALKAARKNPIDALRYE